jgi:hydroxyacylglutathione hydrolase
MKCSLRTTAKVLGAVLSFLLLLVLAFGYLTFGGLSAIIDGVSPARDVRIVKDGIVSLGVVSVADGKVLLIDAGKDPTGVALLRELTRRGLDSHAVSAIFLTHGHLDHTAGVHLFPGAVVYALAADVELAEGRTPGRGPVTRWLPNPPNGTHITRPLKDGETIVVGSQSVRVFAVPGHTRGSAAYLVDGVLFLGDSGSLKSNGSLIGPPWAFTDDSAESRRSLKALADRLRPEQVGIIAIVPAHSGIGTFDPLAQFSL